MGRSPCCDENGLKKGPWSPEEDQKLVRYIQKHGHGSWRALPKLAGLNRCGKSCRLRWTNYLRPDIKRGKFSTEEEQTILNLHSILGNKWSTIATHLAGRTDNEIKNFWNTNLKKKLIQMGFDPMTHRPRSDLFATLPHLIALANLREAIMDHHYSFELHQQQPISSDEAMQLARAQYLHYLQHSANNTTFTSTSESSTMTDLEAINILNSSPALSPSLDSPPALSNINNVNNNLCQSPFCLENGTTIPPPQLPIDDTPYIPAMQDVQFYQTALSEEVSQIRPSFEAFSPGEAIAALASTPSLLADDFTSNMQGTLIPSFWPELLLEEPFYSLS